MFDLFDNEENKKWIRMFWVYFAMTLVFGLAWLSIGLGKFYFGFDMYHDLYGLPEVFTWIVIITGWVLPLFWLRKTIHYYRIIKYGVKSQWK